MMHRTILSRLSVLPLALMMALSIMLASCSKDPEPEVIRFSILGDSYSAFMGYVDPETNDAWPYYENIGVTEVGQMWWRQLMDSTGWQLERNNSFSGALISNYDYLEYYGKHSFLRRMDDLGDPNVIFIFGGANDVWREVALGDDVFEGWTEDQLCSFRPALAYLFDQLKSLYPQATLLFVLDTRLGLDAPLYVSEEHSGAFVSSIREIAAHYDIACIDVYDIPKEWGHPNVDGQKSIADQVIAFIETLF